METVRIGDPRSGSDRFFDFLRALDQSLIICHINLKKSWIGDPWIGSLCRTLDSSQIIWLTLSNGGYAYHVKVPLNFLPTALSNGGTPLSSAKDCISFSLIFYDVPYDKET
jgi:hypothetical protein